jgi:hypothetical protein
MTAPSAAVDFSQYLPPGVYMNPGQGPQLAVNSSQPTAVGLIGQTIGYRNFIQTVQIQPDAGSSTPSLTVVTTTAGEAGTNDVQTLTVTGSPTGGTFTVSFGGQTTSALAFNAAASVFQTAFQALSSVGAGNATVTGSNGGPYTVTFVGTLANTLQTNITTNASSLTGGTSPGVSVTHTTSGAPAIAAVNDVQIVTISGTPAGGTFTLTFGGQTTSALAFNAIGSTVQTALQALSSINSGNVTVTGSASGPYTITFVSALAATPQAVITTTSSLTGGTSPALSVAHAATGSAAIPSVNAVQLVTVTATGGSFTLGFGGQTTTSLPYNSSASTVQAALQALSSIGSANCTVSGNAGGPYTVTFVGALSGQVIALLTDVPSAGSVPTNTQTLAYQGIDTTTVTLTNPTSGQSYTVGVDYTINTISGTTGSTAALYAIARVIGGHLNPGDYAQVAYHYTDPTYYTPYTFYDYDDVRSAYGDPYVLTGPNAGQIQSELTLAAQFAFNNGAFQIVTVAVQSSTTPGNATIGDYGNALNSLRDQGLVAVVVAATGQQPLHTLIQEHVTQQSNNRMERRAIVAVDGTAVAVPSAQRIVDAQEITDTRIMMVCPAAFTYFSPELNTPVTLGGQFMAACLAAITVSQKGGFAMPLTRKTVAGWTAVAELEQEGQKNLESQNGLCVIEKTRTQLIQVRHGVTTDPTDLISREWSIIGQQDAMVYRLRDYLESDNLIGQPIYSFTLINVKGSAEAALQSLIRDGLIVDYTGLKVRQLATNPDVLEVAFSWLPAFPLNYIVCTFNVSLTTGTVTSNSGTSVNSSNVTATTQTSTDVGTPSSSSVNDFGGSANTLQST